MIFKLFFRKSKDDFSKELIFFVAGNLKVDFFKKIFGFLVFFDTDGFVLWCSMLKHHNLSLVVIPIFKALN